MQDIDKIHTVGTADLLEHDRDLDDVWAAASVEFDHDVSRSWRLGGDITIPTRFQLPA
jgi:hypothetical protein